MCRGPVARSNHSGIVMLLWDNTDREEDRERHRMCLFGPVTSNVWIVMTNVVSGEIP